MSFVKSLVSGLKFFGVSNKSKIMDNQVNSSFHNFQPPILQPLKLQISREIIPNSGEIIDAVAPIVAPIRKQPSRRVKTGSSITGQMQKRSRKMKPKRVGAMQKKRPRSKNSSDRKRMVQRKRRQQNM